MSFVTLTLSTPHRLFTTITLSVVFGAVMEKQPEFVDSIQNPSVMIRSAPCVDTPRSLVTTKSEMKPDLGMLVIRGFASIDIICATGHNLRIEQAH
jgi:hypothetical protein